MNRHEYWIEAKYYAATVRDWIKAHPLVSGAIAIAVLSFALGAYAFAATVTCQSATFSGGVLVCETGNPAPTPSPTPTPLPPGGSPNPVPTPYASCPANTTVIRGQWGNTAIVTPDFAQQIVVVEVKVPVAGFSGVKTSTWAEYGGAPINREATFSTVPCDFSNASVLKNGLGQYAHKTGVGFNFEYQIGKASRFTLGLTPGTTYYINIRNLDCPAGIACNMRGGLPQ